MVVPTDIQASFIAGAVFVDWGRRYIEAEHAASPERGRLVRARFCLLGTLSAAMFLGPVIAVFFSAWPAWETQYWTAAAERLRGDGLLSLAAGLYMVALIAAGYFGAAFSVRRVVEGRAGLVRAVWVTVLIVTLGIFLANWPAPIRLGSATAFRASPGSLPYIWQDRTFFWMFVALLLYSAVPYVAVYAWLRRERATSGSGAPGAKVVTAPPSSGRRERLSP